MTTGIRIRNNTTGFIQIDNNYQNLALRASGSYTIPTDQYSGPEVGSFTVNLTSSGLLAFRGNNVAMIGDEVLSGNRRRFTFICPSTQSQRVDYWLFDLPELGISDGASHGLIVRNPSNNKVMFDSRLRYLTIDRFIPEATGTISLAGMGTDFALIPGSRPFQIVDDYSTGGPGGHQFVFTRISSVSTGSSQYTTGTIQSQQPNQGGATVNYRTGQDSHIVVDLSVL